MDERDRNILDELKKDSRQTNKKIAKALGLSEGTIRNRIKKLVNKDIIKRFTVDLNTSRGFIAFVLIQCEPSTPTVNVVRQLGKKKDIARIYETAGEWDVVLEIDTWSAKKFNQIIENVRSIKEIINTVTIPVLKID